ncbi:AAA family ATPase [Methanobrevibacter filiformis]|uniref:AAA family ATPase n=1 Tax=Methanobrevibacter filiformis TaxID=55758 RepID=UPI001FDFD379|nr:AAA family ATPase [Methanobrevibacter filiformis]
MQSNNNIPEKAPKFPSEMVQANSIDEIETRALVLEGAGYPFKLSIMEPPKIEMFDRDLFEQYAKEQWLGSAVSEGSYLFDQKILPDFGFKVITAVPNNSIISEDTSIVLLVNENKQKIFDSQNKDINLTSVESNLSFDDIIGQKHAKSKCKVIKKYFKTPEIFGDWTPKNVLFYGPPGTGKTMLAKSLANELDATLYLVKATNLIGDHVGDGARQIHELFETASNNSPSLIFLDEIDSIALHRNFQALRGDVSEIVNSLLSEMDGISDNEGVVTIAATNNPEQLDYAVRSRFEDEFNFTLPDKKERIAILDKYIETLPIKVEPTSKLLAELTKGMSGRDIKEKILKSSLHHAISNDNEVISMEDIRNALKNAKPKDSSPKNMFI